MPKDKPQFCLPIVNDLGHLLSKKGLVTDSERAQGILAFLHPKTKKQLRGFWGLTGHCRNWIPNFSSHCPTSVCINGLVDPDPNEWPIEREKMRDGLNFSLTQIPTSGLITNYHFILLLHENKGNSLEVLTQRHSDQHWTIGYYNQELHSVAKELCMRAVSTTTVYAKILKKL